MRLLFLRLQPQTPGVFPLLGPTFHPGEPGRARESSTAGSRLAGHPAELPGVSGAAAEPAPCHGHRRGSGHPRGHLTGLGRTPGQLLELGWARSISRDWGGLGASPGAGMGSEHVAGLEEAREHPAGL